eukprot:12847922-Ditylum_brightwellii.AAC.1
MNKSTKQNNKGVFTTLIRAKIGVESEGSDIIASNFIAKPDLQVVWSNQGNEGKDIDIAAPDFVVKPDLLVAYIRSRVITGNSESSVFSDKREGE